MESVAVEEEGHRGGSVDLPGRFRKVFTGE